MQKYNVSLLFISLSISSIYKKGKKDGASISSYKTIKQKIAQILFISFHIQTHLISTLKISNNFCVKPIVVSRDE